MPTAASAVILPSSKRTVRANFACSIELNPGFIVRSSVADVADRSVVPPRSRNCTLPPKIARVRPTPASPFPSSVTARIVRPGVPFSGGSVNWTLSRPVRTSGVTPSGASSMSITLAVI